MFGNNLLNLNLSIGQQLDNDRLLDLVVLPDLLCLLEFLQAGVSSDEAVIPGGLSEHSINVI